MNPDKGPVQSFIDTFSDYWANKSFEELGYFIAVILFMFFMKSLKPFFFKIIKAFGYTLGVGRRPPKKPPFPKKREDIFRNIDN